MKPHRVSSKTLVLMPAIGSSSLSKRLKNSSNSRREKTSRTSLSTRSHHPSGSATTSRKASSASSSAASPRSSPSRAVAVSEARSMCFSAVTPQLPSRSCSSTSTKLRQEESTPQARAVLQSVSLSTLRRTRRRVSSSSKVVLLCSQTEASAASMSSIRWMTTRGLSFMRQWSSRPSRLPRPASSAP